MNIVDIISQHWGTVTTAVGALVYYFTHRAAAGAYAKSKIKSLMLSAEKQSEQLVLNNGQAKFNWVVDKGYALLPSPVRIFVSYADFKLLTQKLFDQAIAFAKSHQVANQAPVVNTNSNINDAGNVVVVAKNSSDQLFT